MRILFYGQLRDAISREVDVEAPERSRIGALRDWLSSRHPDAAAALRRSRCVVGERFVDDDHVPGADSLIEFLPPVSGG